MNKVDAWTLARLLSGHDLNGQLDTLSPIWQRLGTHLASLKPRSREAAWRAFLCSRQQAEADALIVALASVRPHEPCPEADAPSRAVATLADVRRMLSETKWPWPGWLASGVLNGLAADPGTGKTILGADLTRPALVRLALAGRPTQPLPQGNAYAMDSSGSAVPSVV
jgi:hypothetical protein